MAGKNLTTTFRLVDEMSSKMAAIAESGQQMADRFEKIGNTASTAFSAVETSATSTATSIDGVASSIDGHWTSAIGNYDKSAMEAIYTTEELVQMGYKTADALDDEAAAMEAAEQASEGLSDAAENATDTQEELGESFEETGEKGEEAGKKEVNAMEELQSFLASAGIIKLLDGINDAFMETAVDAEKFETSIAQLQTIAGGSHIGELSDDISDLSMATGSASSDLANVAYNAISAGSAVEDAVGTAEAASKLATAGFTDTTSALSVLSTAMNSYGDSAGTATDISNSLIMVQNLGVTTVADLSQQMGRAIAVASGYSVSLGNLESAYISTTKAGINTAQSTTYISGMLNELGSTSSEVSGILMETTGQSFGQLMQSGESLADVLDVLYDSVNGDTEAFMNLWGSSTAGMAASAIINQGLEQFNTNLQAVENSAGATEQAYSIMASTTEFAHQRMNNSMEQVSITVGSVLNPALSGLYDTFADILSGANDFIADHPNVVKATTAIAVGVGAVTAGVALFVAGTKVATVVTAAFGTTLSAAIWPLTAVAAAIAAVTAAVLILKGSYDEAYEEQMSMTASTREMSNELDILQSQYEEACTTYGETSEEASRLKYQIDDLSAALDANGQSVQEFVDEYENAGDALQGIMDSADAAYDAINQEEIGVMALATKLGDLAASTDGSKESQAMMQAIIDQLNESVDGLNLTYDELMSNQDGVVEGIREMAQAEAERQMQQAKFNEWISLYQELADATDMQTKAEQELAAAQADADAKTAAYMEKWNAYTGNGANAAGAFTLMWSDEKAAMDAANDALTDAQNAYDDYTQTVEAAEQRMQAIEDEWGKATDAEEEMSQATQQSAKQMYQLKAASLAVENGLLDAETAAKTYGLSVDELNGYMDEQAAHDEAVQQALAMVENNFLNAEDAAQRFGVSVSEIDSARAMAEIQNIQQEIEELCASYDEAYNSAKSSFEGQFGLFDEASMKSDEYLNATVANAQAALDSQLAYWNSYSANIETLKGMSASDLGITQENYDLLMSYVQDGSEEAAGLAASMVEEIQNGNTEAVTSLANTAGEVQAKQDAIASSVADWQTDFNSKMDELESRMSTAVQNLDLSPEATAAAMNTMNSYANQITSSGEAAVTAAQNIAARVSAALSSASGSISISANAKGTTNADNLFWAGEQGPELVVRGFAGGTTDSPEMFMAGEDGPELVMGAGGSTVFPHSETERLISALSDRKGPTIEYTPPAEKAGGGAGSGGGEQTKRIILEIGGSGPIEITGGANRDAVLKVMEENLRPVLMKLVQSEVYEEGELSYDY